MIWKVLAKERKAGEVNFIKQKRSKLRQQLQIIMMLQKIQRLIINKI